MGRHLLPKEKKPCKFSTPMILCVSFSCRSPVVVRGELYSGVEKVRLLMGHHSLDLTAGSRVYLLEPHWNPMIEEQALCRVHRVGQERNVTTIRYLMRDSFEEVGSSRFARWFLCVLY